MSPVTRRTFLGSAVAAGALLAVDPLPGGPGSPTPAAAETLGTSGTIADVHHVVILMQENRSFDHYFGTLNGVRGYGDISAIQLDAANTVFNQKNGSGRQYPYALTPTATEAQAQCAADLSHSWSTQHSAWNGGKMDSWVSAKGVASLAHLRRSDIPFHFALADNWTVNDAYHCSILSATGPNRTYHWSGWIDPNGTTGSPAANDGGDESGLKWQTYAEALQAAGVSWKVYQTNDNYGDNALEYFTHFQGLTPSSPLYKGVARIPQGSYPTSADAIVAAIRSDVVGGTLPQVSWIVTDQNFSEHPAATPGNGEYIINGVLQALNADSSVFNSTVLLINYDENDGFFDHVPPPVAPAGTADEFYSGTNIGLGFRVPMFAISPWSRGGRVSSEASDHTSVLRFLEAWTTAIGKPATCPNISAWRRKVCGDLTGMFDFANPVYGLPALPTPPAANQYNGSSYNSSPTGNAQPVQEPGTRPARALPYQTNAHLQAFTAWDPNGTVKAWITMGNGTDTDPTVTPATRSAHFAVYANDPTLRGGGPWQYTLDPGQKNPDGTPYNDYFNCGSGYGGGKYDLGVTGPNRFLRRFRGDVTKPGGKTVVTSYFAKEAGTGKTAIWFTFTNNGSSPVTFTVTSNHYRSGSWTYTVAAGSHWDANNKGDYFNNVAYANGWYDYTITLAEDPSWSQRFVGHIETGQASITGSI
ncbi:phosphocholine-specific phospholipase C [Kitasatospora terrestris]|uniref:phospholipase C n=1 Tax=Kitasatospora terrestris TaxID=258051 RepID=A0ABP9EQM2_9ACTN